MQDGRFYPRAQRADMPLILGPPHGAVIGFALSGATFPGAFGS